MMSWLRKLLRAIEPWYDWGPSWAERLDMRGDSELRYFTVEWLGAHIGITYGRVGPLYPSERGE